MPKTIDYLLAIGFGVLVLPPMAACDQAKGTAKGAAAAVGEAEEDLGVGEGDMSTVQNRFVDGGNGTVRDNSTGLIWLKNANCADLGRKTWDEANAAAAALASGACGLTDGSVAGNWRLPTISEFCSAFAGEKLNSCPSTAASSSLIDSSLRGVPFVPNAAGTGLWTEGDAFFGVQSFGYWSATEFDAASAWGVGLSNGSVSTGSKDFTPYVWPVRSGQ